MGEEEKPPAWAAELLQGQKTQSDRLETLDGTLDQYGKKIEKVSETVDEYGDKVEELSASLSDLSQQSNTSFGVIGANFDNLKERAAEDRKRADDKEAELEGKVGAAHVHANEAGAKADVLTGKFANHIEDDHATVAMQTKTDLATHVKNRDQHTGAAPKTDDDEQGPGVHPGVKYGGAGVGGAGLLYGMIELAKVFFAGS